MPVPSLSPQQRADALARAAEARRVRSDLRRELASGEQGIGDVLDAAASDPVIARMRVMTLLEAMPGVGPATAARIMEELGIAPSRRVRGLGTHQRTALLKRFTPL